MPTGLSPWAWSNVYTFVIALVIGGSHSFELNALGAKKLGTIADAALYIYFPSGCNWW